ncbi:MAG: nucleoside monophosphate kinase [Candidatus Aenigmarchaeota archaeon]|nr:nucleoside monophosphate kinase [Candidatus Aenigmarchaeota archaeon]
MKLNIVFLGPPGSGKGTYASRIAPKFGIPHIAVGDIFRKAISEEIPMGIEAKKYYDEGKMVPNEISAGIIIERLSQKDCENGFILDSPYDSQQAEKIDEKIKINVVINLDISEEGVIQRLSTRRVCRKCGAIYNIRTVKPKVEGVCDKCGGELYQRKDDSPEAIRKRLGVYEERSGPLLEYYKERGVLINIDTKDPHLPPEVTVEKIMEELKKFQS